MARNLLSQRVSGFGATIFAEMTALAIQHQAINLGQGFPDFPCPDFVKQAAVAAVQENHNQYARSAGAIPLVERLAAQYSPLFKREIDAMREVIVAVGATEALFSTCQAFLEPGDEVILFEPFYDSYPPGVKMAGATPVFIPLQFVEGDWQFDQEQLCQAFNDKTRLIFVNTPHNPTGKVFSRDELQLIADLCQRHDVIAVCDEVYEHIIFDGHEHLRLGSFPGMWERTITISSAGKTFSTTGWKIGWALAAPQLIHGLQQARQWISFSVATPLQHAAATALQIAEEKGYFHELAEMYQQKRDYLVKELQQAGLDTFACRGTYFVMADFSDYDFIDDVAFCRHLATQIGVAAIPPTSFFCDEHKHIAKKWVRFSFCKNDETLQQAAQRLHSLRKQ